MYSWELKLRRAGEHLKAVDKAVTALLDECENSLGTQAHRDGDVVHVAIHAPSNVISFDVALAAGDCLHNLRSSLDHFIVYLVEMNKGTVTKRTQFPIFVDKADYRRLSPVMIDGLTTDQKAIVQSLQPYGRRDHPLWLLAELSNGDKHRMLQMGVASFAPVSIRLEDGIEHLSTELVHLDGPVIPNAVLARLSYRDSRADAAVNIYPHLEVNVVFDKSTAAPSFAVVPTLQQISTALRDEIFPAFEPIPLPYRIWREANFRSAEDPT